MKKLLILISALAFCLSLNAGDIIFVSGHVTDIETSQPIANHKVYIITNEQYVFDTLTTDINGYYSDSISMSGFTINYLYIFTFDCNFIVHDTTVTNFDYPVVVDFIICNDTFPSFCQAYFYYYPDSLNSFTYNFIDLSSPPLGGNISSWYWDFGDGTTSHEQNPVHIFAEEGMYWVCLTIADSLGNCEDTYCEPVYVFSQQQCIAQFTYYQPPSQPLVVEFTDRSIGNIDTWEWDFGDGNTSEEQNPVHVYQDTGIYYVCLTVSNHDSINFCYDTFCDSVYISITPVCQADFIALVDSTSNMPNFYYFYDNSLGNISEWIWDFGDGAISLEQNPVHQYAESGTYEVCLTIICENAGGYVDFICKPITTPNYYNLGGFAFAGDYPINNPVSTADTGIAYLYRIFNNNDIVAIDTNIFYTLGYFWFTEKMEGDYLIKIGLTPNSARFNEYIPTYFIDGMMWENTNTMSLYDSSYFAVDVHLLQANGTNQGNGKIGGNVIWYDDSPINPGEPIPDVEVLLLDNENNPLTFDFSENDGYFEFDYLAFGTYKLYAEFTGKYTMPVIVTINESNPTVDDIILEVCDHEITGIEDIFYEPDITISNVFPNPATNNLNIEINLKTSQILSLNISNLLGQIIYSENCNLSQGNHIIKIPVRSLQKGIYLLSISNSVNLISVTKKIVKN